MRRWATIITIVFVATGAVGQTTIKLAADFYEARVIGQDVFVRSSADPKGYHCTQLSAPARVTVIGHDASGKWCKILPPPGCYSVISKTHVRLDDAGATGNVRTGKVTGNNVSALAGGYPMPQRYNFSIHQKTMQAGDPVRVIGTISRYYKIEPPRGAYFWIATKYIKRLKGATNASTTAPVADVKADPALAQYHALRKELIAEWKKPAIQRDYLGLAAKFKTLKVSKTSGLQSYVSDTVKFLEQRHQRLLDKAAGAKVVAAADDVDAKWRSEMARMKLGVAVKTGIKPTARGIVTTSTVYPGSPAIARRLVLRDATNLGIRAYLEVSPGGESLLGSVGMLVDVYGPLRHDSDLAVDVVQVERVVVLKTNPLLPAIPQTTLAPVKVKPPVSTQPATVSTQPAPKKEPTIQPVTPPAS